MYYDYDNVILYMHYNTLNYYHVHKYINIAKYITMQKCDNVHCMYIVCGDNVNMFLQVL